jgi:ribonuclease HI
VIQDLHIVEELYGPVEIDNSSLFYLRADVGSNNTAELSAIAEALLWVKDFGTKQNLSSGTASRHRTRVAIYYDSEYAANCVIGTFNGSKNYALYQYCRDLKREVESLGWKIEWQKVKAHSGDVHNDRVDELAKMGCHARCKAGRFSEDKVVGLVRKREGAFDNDDDDCVIVVKKKQKEIVDLT